MIKKFVEAEKNGENRIVLWGTGAVTREFIYAQDAAQAIVKATEHYDRSEPVNIGSGHEISIKELAETVKRLTGFQGEILWDDSKPDGQPRRRLDTRKAKQYFDFEAQTDLLTGLQKTIDWYREAENGG
jgi:GDP-L-fucose synthase